MVETTYVFAWPALVTNDFARRSSRRAIWLTGGEAAAAILAR
jgi:hypothetical protein